MKENIIVFCNGWGMDYNAVKKIKISDNTDLIHFNRWDRLQKTHIDQFYEYKNRFLIAWSMGVWASSLFFKDYIFSKKIAINGTPKGIHNIYGIPEKVFSLTLNNMDENTREVFFKRVGIRDDIYLDRHIEEQIQELQFWWDNKDTKVDEIDWNLAIIGNKDKIFPPQNQLNYWKDNSPNIKNLDIEHYPFYYFKDWEAILKL